MRFYNHAFLLFSILFVIYSPLAEAETIKHTMEGSIDLQITHPESVVIGRTFPVSILIENNGWEDKQDISLIITNPDDSIIPVDTNEIKIDRLSTEGSYGRTIDFKISSDTSVGTHFLNILYSQVLIKNNLDYSLRTVGDMALKRRATMIIESLNLKDGDEILEVGCGNGYYLSLLNRLGLKLQLVGIDKDRLALKDAAKFIGDKKVKFLPLIYQLIVCEESYYGN